MQTDKWINLPVLRGERLLKNILRLLDGSKGMICGGFVRWLASPNPSPLPYGDIDIYGQNLADYEFLRFKFLERGFKIQYESEIAITFKPHRIGWLGGKQQIQLIKPLRNNTVVTHGSLEDVIDNFDFSIIRAGVVVDTLIQNGIESRVFWVKADPRFIKDEENHRLRLIKIGCPIAQLVRINKYLKKGYTLHLETYLQVLETWEQLPREQKEEITKAVRNLDGLPDELALQARDLRDKGCTLKQIAEAVGVTKSVAQEQLQKRTPAITYSAKIEEDDDEYGSYQRYKRVRVQPKPIAPDYGY